MKTLRGFLFMFLICDLLSLNAQELYYPDGTRWGQAWVTDSRFSRPNIDSTYHVAQGNSGLFCEFIVEGTATIPVSETENIECQVVNRYNYDFNNELIGKQEHTCFFSQSGDSIIQYKYSNSHYVGELAYDFSPWRMGESTKQWIYEIPLNEESLEQRELLDGNYYDYIPRITCFRTIGMMYGILPAGGLGRNPSTPVVTYFIRNGVLIYQNNNLIWPEGYVTKIHQPHNDFNGEGMPVCSLQGVVVGNSRNLDALPRGIYILNGKKICIGR